MSEWWENLSTINQWFFASAGFFSIIFLWQVVSTIIGLGGGEDLGGDGDIDGQDFPDGNDLDSEVSVALFRLLSFRAIIAFFTLFSWAAALYLQQGTSAGKTIWISFIWGFAAMFGVAGILYLMQKITETGSHDLRRSVGNTGRVYLDIPSSGDGQVRVLVGRTVSFVKARGVEGRAMPSGTPVRIVRVVDSGIVEVEPLDGDPRAANPNRKG